ncbi:MAG: response regulator transcription factor [Spirochaetales bacterium]|nr:response regulator transcription factor [Spirochaetales bacterium]
MNRIRVALVDDDGLIRDGLGAILEMHDDIELVGVAEDGEAGVVLCSRTHPDVVLMDIRMPILDGVAAAARIKQERPDVKVIMLTTFQDDASIRSAVALGAEGYILKSSSADTIIESVRAVFRGTTVLQNDVARTLGSILADAAAPRAGADDRERLTALGLSPRELDVLTLIAQGHSNKEIASELRLSDGTVRNYISDMLTKLAVRDRTQLAILYYRSLGGD